MTETQELHVDARLEQDVLVLTFRDKDIQTDSLAETLRDQLLDAVQKSKSNKVILDFQKVVYLSSAGFRPLLSLRRYLHEKGGRMVLCNLHPEVANVFRITRLISTNRTSTAPFEREDDLAAALARINLVVE